MTAFILAAAVLSSAPSVSWRVDLGGSAPLSAPSTSTYGFGIAGAATAELELLKILGLDIQVGYTRVERRASAGLGGAGTLLYLGAGVRTHTPFDGSLLMPWFEFLAGWGYSGGSRLTLSGTAGLSARPGSVSFFRIGAFVRVQEVLNLQGGLHVTLLSFGLSAELKQPRSGDAPDRLDTEHTQPLVLGDEQDRDRDKDGLANDSDACPLVAGSPSDQGCPLYPRITVHSDRLELKDRITFGERSAIFTGKSSEVIDDLAKVLTDRPGLCVLITAHTDNSGSSDDNLSLSGNQAQAVRAALVKKSVSVDRLNTRGFGEQKPITQNRTPEEREKNRRIEILVVPCSQPL